MFVLVDVCLLMLLSLATCLPGTPVIVAHGFILSRHFHHENIVLLRVTFQFVHSCWPLLLPTFA